MNCPECNTNKETRSAWVTRTCPCCNGIKRISFNRFVQWRIGGVTWLSANGSQDASVEEMNMRCLNIVKSCYAELNKPIKWLPEPCTLHSASPLTVTWHFANQFKSNDCLLR